MSQERNFYLPFSLAPGIGPKRFAQLLSFFGSARKAYSGTESEFKKAGVSESFFEKFNIFRKSFKIDAYLKKLKSKNVEFITFIDKNYPARLKKIDNPPIVLFVKGSAQILSTERSIAVVGTRKMTSYGREVTENLVSELAPHGFIVVSGLALGIDSTAHKTALASGGKTIAVLGCGVDCCYPRENENLYNRIIEKGGAIVSEYPLGLQPNRGTFPARNRIIAGLGNAVLVTEAGKDSGALITASNAASQGKTVFAVPGPITSKQSVGTSILIKKGAKLVSQIQDILEEFGIGATWKKKTIDFKTLNLTPEEKSVINTLENESYHIDELSRICKIQITKLSTLLSSLEMQGLVLNRGAGVFGLK